MSGGGSSGSKTQTVQSTSTTKLPAEIARYIPGFMEQSQQVANLPYQPYGGTTVAPLNQLQLQGLSNTVQRALTGSPVSGAAEGSVGNILQGNALNRIMGVAGQQNPYLHQYTNLQANPFIGQTTNVGTNPLLGLDNPYLNAAIGQAQGDVSRQYELTTLPDLLRMEHASGAFGNSGLQEYKQEAQRQLAQELGDISTNMRMQDYGLQAQLGESDVARRAQYNQADIARNLAAFGDQAALRAQLRQADIARNLAGVEGDQAQRIAALQSAYAQQLQAAGMAPQLSETGYRDIQALLGAGDVLQNYQTQKLLEQYGNWQTQQQYPYSQLDVLANALRASQGAGSSSSTTTQSPNPYQANRTANAIGGAAVGYGLGGADYGALGAALGGLGGYLL